MRIYSYLPGVLFLAAIAATACAESDNTTTTGLNTLSSGGVTRNYYVQLPTGYDPADSSFPLVFGFHGTEGDHTKFTLNEYYNLHGAVGEEAILVYPNALKNHNGVNQWDYDIDVPFFDDLFAKLEATVSFDKDKVFAVGHSSGAGFAHHLGCKRGDVLRAIAPVAGTLVDPSHCIGQVAVIQIEGKTDTMVPPPVAENGRDYWVAINRCQGDQTVQGVDPYCAAYQGCDADFPVQYCLHDLENPDHDYPGHAWPPFAGPAIWDFFKSLPRVHPSKKTGTGIVPEPATRFVSYTIAYPSDFKGTPEKMAISLYPAGTDARKPIFIAPTYILNADVPIGDYKFGSSVSYKDAAMTNIDDIPPGTYAFMAVIYVKGGQYPIPTTGQDYVGSQEIAFSKQNMELKTPIELFPLKSF